MDHAQVAAPSIVVRPGGGKWLRAAVLVGIIALVVVGGDRLWEKVLKGRLFPHRFGVVDPGSLYRRGQISSTLIKPTLTRYNIRVIVDLTSDVPSDPDQAAESRAAAELGIQRYKFPLSGDGTGDIHQYENALRTVLESQAKSEPVLVHCAAGSERTGGLVAFYRVLVQHRSPAEAYREMESYGWSPKRNTTLIPYLNDHMAEMAASLLESGALKQAPEPLPVMGGK